MSVDDQDISAALEDGSYFQAARRWYSDIYISVISQRYFFIILTTLAALTGLLALIGILRLMPLTPRAPFLYEADDAFNQIPIVRPIKTYRTQDINDALRRFFLNEYVQQREGYSSDSVTRRINFVRNHSDRNTFARYGAYMDVRNPRSPVQELGIYSTKLTRIESSQVTLQPITNRQNYWLASIPFSVTINGQQTTRTTNFRADVTFFYKDLIVEQTRDMEEDKPFDITPMRFIVTDYKVRQFR
jgi:type IV secretory pathway component VirB8